MPIPGCKYSAIPCKPRAILCRTPPVSCVRACVPPDGVGRATDVPRRQRNPRRAAESAREVVPPQRRQNESRETLPHPEGPRKVRPQRDEVEYQQNETAHGRRHRLRFKVIGRTTNSYVRDRWGSRSPRVVALVGGGASLRYLLFT